MFRRISLLLIALSVTFNLCAAQGKDKKKKKGDKEWPVTFVIDHADQFKVTDEQMKKLEYLQDMEEKITADPAVKEISQKLRQAKKSGDEADVTAQQERLGAKIKERSGGQVTSFMAALGLVLTPDQMTKYKEMRKPAFVERDGKDPNAPKDPAKDVPMAKNPFDF